MSNQPLEVNYYPRGCPVSLGLCGCNGKFDETRQAEKITVTARGSLDIIDSCASDISPAREQRYEVRPANMTFLFDEIGGRWQFLCHWFPNGQRIFSKERESLLCREKITIMLISPVIILLLCSCIAIDAEISNETRDILMELYDSTIGDGWFESDGWGTEDDPCTWTGIECDDDSTQITSLNLFNNDLQGTLPPSLSNLTSLTYLNLSYNLFDDGLAVPDLRLMTKLDTLDVSYCLSSYTGAISLNGLPLSMQFLYLWGLPGLQVTTEMLLPLRILSLLDVSYVTSAASIDWARVIPETSLTSLALRSLGLTGDISPWLFKVKRLYVDFNRLHLIIPENCSLLSLSFNANLDEGPIPAVERCPNLEELDLSRNQFTGILNLVPGCALNVLYVWNTLLSGVNGVRHCTYLEQLYLHENQIAGSMLDLRGLSYLRFAYLTNNLLSGEITNELEGTSIMELDLSINFFFGSIPASIFHEEVKIVNLAANEFSGSLPPLDAPTYIFQLDVSYNNLSGTIPYLPTVSFLYLEYNRFEGIFPSIEDQIYLFERWTINNNQFSGHIFDILPDQCDDVTVLKYIDASFNNFSGDIPRGLANCNNIQILKLDHNQLSTYILSGNLPFFNNSMMSTLTLDFNAFSGELPYPFASAPLEILSISHNNLTGSFDTLKSNTFNLLSSFNASYNQFSVGPFDVSNGWVFSDQWLKALKTLDISHNELVGPIFNSFISPAGNNLISGRCIAPFIKIPTLTILDLSDNPIYGIIPNGMDALTSLIGLNLKNTKIGGRLPSSLKRLISLQELDLSDNYLVGNDLSWLQEMKGLQYLNLSNNQLTATISSVNAMKSLKNVDLSDNMLVGSISEFCSIKSLVTFIASRNSLNGSICTFTGDVTELRLDHNQFSGDTSFFSLMSSLQYLDISSNQLTRQLPIMSRLSKLTYINVSRNDLEGEVPDLIDLQRLSSLDLSHNRFNGTVPSISSSSSFTLLDVSNNDFTWADQFSLSSNISYCNMTNIMFECPISESARFDCGAVCTSSYMESANISVKVAGDINTFNRTKFIDVIASFLNNDVDRFTINGLRSGSVIVDMTINPPTSTSYDGSAVTLVNQMLSNTFASSLAKSDYTLLLVGSYIPSPTVAITSIQASPKESGSNSSMIIGIVVALFVVIFTASVVTAVILWRKRVRSLQRRSQMMMVDMSTMNMTAVQRSVVEYKELENMKMIGSGAFGIVFSAQWRGIKVAVKQVKAEYVDEQQVKEFLHEVAVMQNLRPHPHVVLFMGITVPPEYCGGGSLLSYLRENFDSVTNEQKMSFIMQIAQGMLHLHMEKIIHRDLAVRNVADFGMSRQQVEDVQTTSTNIGPVRWMAPEAMRERNYSNKTDAYSFGVLVWEIVTNREPYEDMDMMTVAINVMNNNLRPEIPDATDPLLKRLMQACWNENPAERPNFAQICKHLGLEVPDEKGADEVMPEEKATDKVTMDDKDGPYQPISENPTSVSS
ncbi:LRR receptor-like serine/threonine-protein kinase GSO1-like [Planoprotostelium fungivorum]|uniref:LRR receptor-like serine/threonine-protein kinase GSO1-like n=1 Tax=Planoprotostelium fungivorum TaxID=1890364 RepID=A0A2P6NMK9_9EUKA|nr:LRR receptor-like serine/threonine-protein kinase GSO1-like [Planoprotostelium fungivorum]